MGTSKEIKPAGCGCLLVFVAVGLVVIGTCMAVVHFVSDSMCDKMKKVDYVPERAGELEWGIVEAAQLRYHFENVAANKYSLRLYCEDEDAFWRSDYAPEFEPIFE